MSEFKFRKLGYIKIEELEKLKQLPSRGRMLRGPVAILECPEQIPCNICVEACPVNAIEMGKIYELPVVNWDKCTGCGMCVAMCPGLAAFVVDLSRSECDYVTVPHEFIPKPKKGDQVVLLDRQGNKVGIGEVIRVWERNKTMVVTVKTPKGLGMEVRAIWPAREE
ncbi:MAG: 4Fe-4S binding protein [Desulfurococcaceae archaeon]